MKNDITSSNQRFTYTWIFRDKNGDDVDTHVAAFSEHAPPLPYVGAPCSVTKPDGTSLSGYTIKVDYSYALGDTYLTYGSFIYVEIA